jgi:hypothetical protein
VNSGSTELVRLIIGCKVFDWIQLTIDSDCRFCENCDRLMVSTKKNNFFTT